MTNITESFLRWKIAQTITSTESVPFNKKVSKVPVLTSGFITISPDTENEEIFLYSGVSWTPWKAWTITITWRGYNKENDTQDSGNQKPHTINAVFKWALNHIIINEKADLSDAKFTWELRVPVFANATARDVAITSPEDWLLAYLNDIEDFTSYKNWLWINWLGWSWSAIYYHESSDSTLTWVVNWVNVDYVLSNSPASPSAVTVLYNGNVQEYLVDYTIIATTITFTTAPTSWKVSALYPDTPVGSGNAKTRATTSADASNGEIFRDTADSDNLYYKDNAWTLTQIYDEVTNKIPIWATDLDPSTDFQASTTTPWFVELATNAEVVTGTDTSRYITPKQLKDNCRLKDSVVAVRAHNWTPTTTTYSHWLWRIPDMIEAFQTYEWWVNSKWTWLNDWSNTNKCAYMNWNITSATSSTYAIIEQSESSGTEWQLWIINNVTTTDFDVVWTQASTPTIARNMWLHFTLS